MKKNIYNKYLFILIITLILMLFFSTFIVAKIDAEKPTSALTIVPQKEMLNAITEGRFKSVVMIPPGFSPANYAPTPMELRDFSEAKIYFSIGVPADIQNILPRAEGINKELKIVKLFELVDKKFGPREFEDGGRDPHIWLSPSRTIYMVNIMAEELSRMIPENKDFFMENADKYIEKIKEVDSLNNKLLEEYSGKKLLVYHPSLGYFTDHYGLEMMTIEDHGKEPGPKQIQKIIEAAKKENIKTIFYQSEIDSKKSKAIAEELGGRVVQLDPLSENYLDNLKKMAEIFAETLSKRDDL